MNTKRQNRKSTGDTLMLIGAATAGAAVSYSFYQSGYTAGFQNGYQQGDANGYNRGYNDGLLAGRAEAMQAVNDQKAQLRELREELRQARALALSNFEIKQVKREVNKLRVLATDVLLPTWPDSDDPTDPRDRRN